VHDSVELLRPLAVKQGIAIEADLSSVRCWCDAEQIAQGVTNLVSNAISYNRPGGRVNVSLSSAGATAILTVSDTGKGIPPEDLPHIFERFYRADKARSKADGCTGLGLSITKAIVEAHGGTIRAVSSPGLGSEFTVQLPGVAQTS
jgi:signal transduction histidine kinase